MARSVGLFSYKGRGWLGAGTAAAHNAIWLLRALNSMVPKGYFSLST